MLKHFGGIITAVVWAACVVPASASSLIYTCDSSIDATQAGTCAYLNSTISSLYTSTFSNVNANIYIEQGVTGLGSSTPGYYNYVSFNSYLHALQTTASSDTVDTGAVAALQTLDSAMYGSGNVVITSALGTALGFHNLNGTTANGNSCTIGTAGCYNGIITITTPANLSSETSGTQSLYWRQNPSTASSSAYDFYSVVEHETDELLGTASCIDTTGASLTDPCAQYFGAGAPSAVDLFRYSSAGQLVPDSALSTTPGAYFSYNGGVTNGAAGAVYNTLSNGQDYSDFVTGCPGNPHVQDVSGCLGAQFLNIGAAEINILDAVGYNVSSTATPEPGSMGLIGCGLVVLAGIARRRARR